uniref:Bifunctional NAD(P)H-hydrate repair enzyme n=1 Tax=Desulfobacca acetoxidans TaxID=60893 RepID=A0A7V4G7E4_9BACT
MKLVTASEMRELDRRTIQDLGVPSLVLMENAGRGTYQVIRREFPHLAGPVAVLAGRGNNGGDGFVVARYLANAGIPVMVFLLAARDQVQGDARVNFQILQGMGVEVAEVITEAHLNHLCQHLTQARLVVDALLGTGLNSPVRGLMAQTINRLNQLAVPRVSVDIPSGLSADTGKPLGVCVEAQVTVTYGFPKLGQILPPGRDLVGRLWLVDISIPPALAQALKTELAEVGEMRGLLPHRPRESHKGTYGHLVVVAGSEGKTGAAVLAAEGGLRTGAGLVTAAVPAGLNDILEVKLTEAMTLPLPEAQGVRALGAAASGPLKEFLAGKTAVALGPGLGTHPETQELVRALVRECPLPLVIDADGVNALAGHLEVLHHAPGPRILTPHPGEMARLLGVSPRDIQDRRLEVARETALAHGIYLILKGAQTVVAGPQGHVSVNPSGNPALASGGTGDVLTGLVGGYLAQRLSPWDAARLGVYLHGLAADYLVANFGPHGHAAGDLLQIFPELLAEFTQEHFPPTEEEACLRLVIS